MKNHPLLAALTLSLTLILTPARAENPASVTLTPEMRELLAQLLKDAEEARQDPASQPEPAPQPAAPKEAKAPAAAPAKSNLQASGLSTGGLTTSALTPSAPLGGRGTTGGAARLSEEDWRALFAKAARK